jgi:hypothetical protein
MAINFLFLSAMILILGVIVVARQREELIAARDKYAGELRDEQLKATNVEDGMREAIDTMQRYQKEIMRSTDDNLNVSYWIRHDGAPYVFVTTEKGDTQDNFRNDRSSIIGCGFDSPSKVVDWQEKGKTRVFDFAAQEKHGHGCEMDPRVEPIKQIVCSAYQPSGAKASEATVGICVFTASDKHILVGDYQKLLRKRTIEFYEAFHARIENRQVTTLNERRKSTKLN